MELINIDPVEAQPLEAAFQRLSEMLRTGIMSPLARTGTLPSALGGNDKPRRVGIQRFGDQLFRDVRAIRVCRVDQVNVQFNRAPQGRKGCSVVGGRPPDTGAGDTHGSVAQTVDSEVASDGEGARGSGSDDKGVAHVSHSRNARKIE